MAAVDTDATAEDPEEEEEEGEGEEDDEELVSSRIALVRKVRDSGDASDLMSFRRFGRRMRKEWKMRRVKMRVTRRATTTIWCHRGQDSECVTHPSPPFTPLDTLFQ